jgi:hypothetical protein
VKITVTTDNGHKAELTTTRTGDHGLTVARAVAYWRGVRTPAIELKTFANSLEADRYLKRLAAALVDRDALEEVEFIGCKHANYEMLGRHDDIPPDGPCITWSPICRDCGADVPMKAES